MKNPFDIFIVVVVVVVEEGRSFFYVVVKSCSNYSLCAEVASTL